MAGLVHDATNSITEVAARWRVLRLILLRYNSLSSLGPLWLYILVLLIKSANLRGLEDTIMLSTQVVSYFDQSIDIGGLNLGIPNRSYQEVIAALFRVSLKAFAQPLCLLLDNVGLADQTTSHTANATHQPHINGYWVKVSNQVLVETLPDLRTQKERTIDLGVNILSARRIEPTFL